MSKLTHKQERFAQLVADGCNHSEAYRQAYDVSPDCAPSTIWKRASELAADGKVAGRIAELRQAVADAVAQRRAWDQERLAEEAEINLDGARCDRKWASANGALELIGRVTGILSDKPREQLPVAITRIVIHVDRGAGAEGQPQIEAESYQVLPRPHPELAEGAPVDADAQEPRR